MFSSRESDTEARRASWSRQLCALLERERIVDGEMLPLLHRLSQSLTLRAISADLRTAVFVLRCPDKGDPVELILRAIKGSLFTTFWNVFARFDDEYSLSLSGASLETSDTGNTGSSNTETNRSSSDRCLSTPSSSKSPSSYSSAKHTNHDESQVQEETKETKQQKQLFLWRLRGFEPATFTLCEGEMHWQRMHSIARWLGLGEHVELVAFTRVLNQLVLNLPAFVRSKDKEKLEPPMPLCYM